MTEMIMTTHVGNGGEKLTFCFHGNKNIVALMHLLFLGNIMMSPMKIGSILLQLMKATVEGATTMNLQPRPRRQLQMITTADATMMEMATVAKERILQEKLENNDAVDRSTLLMADYNMMVSLYPIALLTRACPQTWLLAHFARNLNISACCIRELPFHIISCFA
jgi:hypothetical protein